MIIIIAGDHREHGLAKMRPVQYVFPNARRLGATHSEDAHRERIGSVEYLGQGLVSPFWYFLFI